MDSINHQGGRTYGELRARQDSYIDALNRDILLDDDYRYVHMESLKEKLDFYKRKFMEYDVDHSGDIDFSELKHMLESLGQPRTHLEAKQLLRSVTAEGKHAIDYRQFVDMLLGNSLNMELVFSEEADQKNKSVNELEKDSQKDSSVLSSSQAKLPTKTKQKRQAPKPPSSSRSVVKRVSFGETTTPAPAHEPDPDETNPYNSEHEPDQDKTYSDTIEEEPDQDKTYPDTTEHPKNEVADYWCDDNKRFVSDVTPSTEPPPYMENIEPRERRKLPVITTEVLPKIPDRQPLTQQHTHQPSPHRVDSTTNVSPPTGYPEQLGYHPQENSFPLEQLLEQRSSPARPSQDVPLNLGPHIPQHQRQPMHASQSPQRPLSSSQISQNLTQVSQASQNPMPTSQISLHPGLVNQTSLHPGLVNQASQNPRPVSQTSLHPGLVNQASQHAGQGSQHIGLANQTAQHPGPVILGTRHPGPAIRGSHHRELANQSTHNAGPAIQGSQHLGHVIHTPQHAGVVSQLPRPQVVVPASTVLNKNTLPKPYKYPVYTNNSAVLQSYIQPCTIPGCTDCPKVYPESVPNGNSQLYPLPVAHMPTTAPMLAYPVGYPCTCAACLSANHPQGIAQATCSLACSCQQCQGFQGHQNTLGDRLGSLSLNK